MLPDMEAKWLVLAHLVPSIIPGGIVPRPQLRIDLILPILTYQFRIKSRLMSGVSWTVCA